MCVNMPSCVQPVPSIDDRGARNCVCVRVCLLVYVKVRSVTFLDSDRLKPSVEHSRLWWVFSTREQIHTHTHTQWSVQGVNAVCSLSLHPAGTARLTKPDWHCQELCEHSVWIYIRALSSFINAFCGETPSMAALAVRGWLTEAL